MIIDISEFEKLKLNKNRIYTIELKVANRCTVIGIYSTIEKAAKAIRFCYSNNNELFQVQEMCLDANPECATDNVFIVKCDIKNKIINFDSEDENIDNDSEDENIYNDSEDEQV